ncbi:hypothetical protein M5X17_31380 [Paenibacillus alvei]|uniref:hypothetical protein n=1 Tax=Paenibacillus alvei TaxID=44250 RepID=UPI0022828DF4|nr:hypothetical protein [Paenibacillus alvei]MCY9738197.1 hypothetical protein [Paenibacillus alvei]
MSKNMPTYDQLYTMFCNIEDALNSDFKAYEKMIMVVVSFHKAKYGSAFPEYDTLAQLGGMSKRKAQYCVKELDDAGLIDKMSRYIERADGTTRQTSNEYQLNARHASIESSNAQCATDDTFDYAHHASYRSKDSRSSTLLSFKSFSFNTSTEKEEEYYYNHAISASHAEIDPRTYQNYEYYQDTYHAFMLSSGRDYITQNEQEFMDVCEEFNYSPNLAYAYAQKIMPIVNVKPSGAIRAAFVNLEIQKESAMFDEYRDLYEDMAAKDGGMLSFNHKEFLLTCKEQGIASIVAKRLYEKLGSSISTCSYKALVASLQDFAYRFKSGLVNKPVEWFKTKLENECLRYAV